MTCSELDWHPCKLHLMAKDSRLMLMCPRGHIAGGICSVNSI